MQLIELIRALEAEDDPDMVVPLGFDSPHSWRGSYYELAFEPAENVTVAHMLEVAQSAVGTTYEGYKGGSFTMSEWSECYLASYGDLGESLGPILLHHMLDAGTRTPSTYPLPMAADGEEPTGYVLVHSRGSMGSTLHFGPFFNREEIDEWMRKVGAPARVSPGIIPLYKTVDWSR